MFWLFIQSCSKHSVCQANVSKKLRSVFCFTTQVLLPSTLLLLFLCGTNAIWIRAPILPLQCFSDVQIIEHYRVPDFHTALEFLSLLARRQGKLRKGGLHDTDKAAKSVLMDWTGLVENKTFEVCQMMINKCFLHRLNFNMLCHLEEGSATSRTLQKHTLFPHMSVLRLLQRWVKLLTGMSWKRGIRRFLQVKIKGHHKTKTLLFCVLWYFKTMSQKLRVL